MIGGLQISPNPATVSIATGGGQDFTVTTSPAVNQAAGTYAGNIEWGVCNRPNVEQQLTLDISTLACPMVLSSPSPATVDPGRCVEITAALTNGQCAMTDIRVSSTALSGRGNEITFSSMDIGSRSLDAGAVTTVRVSTCPVACQPDGDYTGVLTVSGTTGYGPQSVSKTVTVHVTNKAVTAGSVVAAGADPGALVQWTAHITNSGAAPIGVGELSASLPTLVGPGAPITGLTISPNPGTIEIAAGSSSDFVVRATSAVNQTAGNYGGEIAWVLCNRQAARQSLTLAISSQACAVTLSPPDGATVDPGGCVQLTAELVNGQCALRNISLSSPALAGPGGVMQVASLTIDKSSLAAGERTRVRITACAAGCLLNGSYAGTLSLTGTTDFGVETASAPVSIGVTSKSITVSAVAAVGADPGAAVQWAARVVNNGTAPIGVGDLRVTIPTLERTVAGTSDPVNGLFIAPDPSTVAIPIGGSQNFTVSTILNAGQRDGRYQGHLDWVVCTRAPLQQDLTLDVNAVPRWSYDASPANLACGVPLTVMVTNLGNSDLNLSVRTLSGPVVAVTPNLLVVPYRGAPQALTLSVPCGDLNAGTMSGQIECQDGTSGPRVQLAVNTLVGETPRLGSVASAGGRVFPGGIVIIRVPIQNTGNVRLTSVRIVEADDFVPSRGGASVHFPDALLTSDRALEIGARDTIPVLVNVGSGFFAGTYSSRIKLRGASANTETFASVNLAFDVMGTPERMLAFSNNPARFSESRSVTIAVGGSGVSTSIKVYNPVGALVRTLANNQMLSGGTVTWDFKNEEGSLVASGLYVVIADVGGQRTREKLLFVK